MRKSPSLLSVIMMSAILCASVNSSAEAAIPMPSPMVGGLIKIITSPVKVVVQGSAKIVKKTVKIATAPIRVLTR